MGFTRAELNDLYEALNMYDSIKSISAYDLYMNEQKHSVSHITTFSDEFDRILGGKSNIRCITLSVKSPFNVLNLKEDCLSEKLLNYVEQLA